MILGVSLLLLLAGERLFKPTLFLSGFGLASVFSFFGLNAAFNAAHWRAHARAHASLAPPGESAHSPRVGKCGAGRQF